jgi:anaerobic magnesium-protoporphyrin IX monomethyl ester cyclase
LLYLASVLERLGHDVKIVDLAGIDNWSIMIRDILSKEVFDLFGITCVTPNFEMSSQIANLLKESETRTPIVVGGVHPTVLPWDVLRNIQCDVVVRGEAELILENLMNDFRNDELKQIYDGFVVPSHLIPRPARHLVDLHRYSPGGEEATPVYTSRGCSFNCSFCSKLTGRTYRPIPLKQVLDEIQEVISYGFKHVVFGDDNIGIQPQRLEELLNSIKPLGITFRLNQDARHVKERLLELASEAGCTEISYGIESGSQKMLDLMNKQNTVEQNRRAIELTRNHGMSAKAYFMVNFPGETEETVKDTLRFAEVAMPDKWLLSAFAPLPGCEVFSHPDKFGITWMSKNWGDYYLVGKEGKFKPCFKTRYLTFERQIELHEMLYSGLKDLLG